MRKPQIVMRCRDKHLHAHTEHPVWFHDVFCPTSIWMLCTGSKDVHNFSDYTTIQVLSWRDDDLARVKLMQVPTDGI